ncbi:hypothetical protein [Marinoscillum sp. MHG1-6]|uniref:Cbp1 family collagen-binding glycoprotein adhesin n=1 Tax=Marinoscillum sp. MHG1-6 TaxID=2959627 RepID=UPI002156FD42|nr:hypothetical protein [Marinoscillum sp. MHG1-6]
MKNHFKTIIITVLAGSTLLFSCTDQKEREELKKKAAMLEAKLMERDSAYNELIDIMSTVEGQIASIKEKENIVSLKSEGDFTDTEKDQIITDMEAIDQLIAHSSETIRELSNKLERADVSSKSFKKKVKDLTASLENRKTAIDELKEVLIAKDVEIANLVTQVSTLETSMEIQEETIDMQIETINNQEERLNTAYFVVGPEKSLMDQGIVTKEGGFLWLGKTTELEANSTKEKFVQIDIRDTDKLVIDSKKAELITEHPTDSYELISEGDKVQYLSIINPEKFWGISKFLVISTKS